MNNKTKTMILVLVVLTSMIFVSGCVGGSPIKSQEDVGRVVTNVSSGIENIGSTLEDIDKVLGGG